MQLEEEILKKLNKIYGKFLATQGLPVWGAVVKTAQGDFRVLYVDDDGKLVVSATREDIISLGGVASPNNAGVVIVAPVAGQKVKVYDAGYEGAVNGLHYFYFGTSTTATAKRLMATSTKGVRFKTFVQPRIGDTGDGLYLFSAVSETNMPYDVGYVQE